MTTPKMVLVTKGDGTALGLFDHPEQAMEWILENSPDAEWSPNTVRSKHVPYRGELDA